MGLTKAGGALRDLAALEYFGMKAGLRNIRHIARSLGNPQDAFPSVHIAGTNGKGSTASMLAAILTASGYRTGLYTSPHLVSFTERIRIDGMPIGRSDLDARIREVMPHVRRFNATFFEAMTAAAFTHFARAQVDIAVIETGLGGRLDATNIVRPLLSIITSIGLDHTAILGRTLGAIAAEKGGIIKPGVPCLTAVREGEALGKLSGIARRRRAPLLHAARVALRASSIEGITAEAVVLGKRMSVLLPLPGAYQGENLALALGASAYLRTHRRFVKITRAAAARGLREVRRLSGLRGRLELVRDDPPVIADVAHNPDAMRRSAVALAGAGFGRGVVALGVMADKDYGPMLDALAPISRCIVALQPSTRRALPAAALLRECRARGLRGVLGGGVREGIALALTMREMGEPLLITGSHYTVGEFLQSEGV